MKLRIFSLSLLAAGSVALTSCLFAEVEKREAPSVKVDDTPVASVRGAPAVVSYADQIERVQPAVVSVHSSRFVSERSGGMNPLMNDPFFRRFFGIPEENTPNQNPGQRQRRREETGLGSGVIVTGDGYILTNNHVIEGADELEVALSDDRRFKAKVIGTDPQTDIAVIKIDATDLPFVTLGDSDKVRVGDVVFALGNPLGVGQTVTMGIVSAKGRQINILNNNRTRGYEDFIQTDAAINRGNSGGALVDAAGRLVGINSAIISPNMGAGNVGIGFAIPINLASHIMTSLVTTGEVSRGFLGVSLQDVTDDLVEEYGLGKGRGAIVTEVVADGPADKAGLMREDVVTAVDGRAVRSVQELRLRIASIMPGTDVELTVIREKKERKVTVQLGRLDDSTALATGTGRTLLDGVEVSPINDATRTQFEIPENIRAGLVVTGVSEESKFSQVFQPGVLILSINGVQPSKLSEAREALRIGRNRLLLSSNGFNRIVSIMVTEEDR